MPHNGSWRIGRFLGGEVWGELLRGSMQERGKVLPDRKLTECEKNEKKYRTKKKKKRKKQIKEKKKKKEKEKQKEKKFSIPEQQVNEGCHSTVLL